MKSVAKQNNQLPTYEQIADRAYQLFLQRGGNSGHEIDDWLQAEYELMQLPVSKIAGLNAAKNKKTGIRTSALVTMVQLALLMGAEALPYLKR